jgi:cytoskeletal protein CcmA (bactofilin family)
MIQKELPMALASPFFGKRDPEPAPAPYSPNSGRNLNGTARTEPVNNLTQTGLRGEANAQLATAASASASASASAKQNAASAGAEGGSRLIVGPNIKLKGVEITDCDTLVVEGTVEATMDSRVIQIMANGAFKGSADIDIAEIHGQFDGNLTVRDKLVIYAQGKVNGMIRYGKVIIEEGGQLSGDVQFGAKTGQLTSTPALIASAPKMGIHVAS